MFEEEVLKQLIFIPLWFIAYSVFFFFFFLCKPACLGMSSILPFFCIYQSFKHFMFPKFLRALKLWLSNTFYSYSLYGFLSLFLDFLC